MTYRIGLLVYPEFQILDVTGPIAAFEVAGRLAGMDYDISVLSKAGGPVHSSAGIALPSKKLANSRSFDTILVSGGSGSRMAMECSATVDFLKKQALAARRIGSVCTGAFLLAAAGLLDGKKATTHWRRAAELAQRFPSVMVMPDSIHVVDGSIWTSAGISAGIDLSLAMIAADAGEAAARAVAQEMVVYYRRPGGQSQFSALLEINSESGRFADLLCWIRNRLADRLTVEVLAERMAMSPRNFSRAFTRDLGQSPAKAIERLRVEAAKGLVESSSLPIEQIARQTGFTDPERMRRAFLRAFGHPPQALRRLAGI